MVRQELEANIALRGKELELLGLGPEEGVRRALGELGAPTHVSRGMAGLYSAPRGLRWAFGALLAAWCCVSPLNPLTARVQASPITDATGHLTGIRLGAESFSSALAATGMVLEGDGGLWRSRRFTTARSWDAGLRHDLQAPNLTDPDLDLRQALTALCDLNASVRLEDSPNAVAFRVTWAASESRIELNLSPSIARQFHQRLSQQLESPCQP